MSVVSSNLIALWVVGKNLRPLSVVGKSRLIFWSPVGNCFLVLSVVSNIFSQVG